MKLSSQISEIFPLFSFLVFINNTTIAKFTAIHQHQGGVERSEGIRDPIQKMLSMTWSGLPERTYRGGPTYISYRQSGSCLTSDSSR